MRRIISGVVAAIALMAATAGPASACGYGGCYPYIYSGYAYGGCGACGGWYFNRLADPETQYHAAEPPRQYYYADQGPTYTGPDAFAPYYPFYPEGAVASWDAYRHRPYYGGYHWRHHYVFHPHHHYRHHDARHNAGRYGSNEGRGYY
jgi:hypothetical protein